MHATVVGAEDIALQKLKAQYVANIASFVSWDSRPREIVLCVQSDSALSQYTEELEGFELGQGRHLGLKIDAESLDGCQILYWDIASEKLNLRRLMETRHLGLLVISDLQSEQELAVAVNLYAYDSKIKFAINQQELIDKEYKISSRLMRLSRQAD